MTIDFKNEYVFIHMINRLFLHSKTCKQDDFECDIEIQLTIEDVNQHTPIN